MAGCNTREENAAEAQAEFEELKSRIPLMVTDRERDTIIAALRLWQWYLQGGFKMPRERRTALMEIAENGREGGYARLSDADIDELIEERINV